LDIGDRAVCLRAMGLTVEIHTGVRGQRMTLDATAAA
jgi:hypothetical protein